MLDKNMQKMALFLIDNKEILSQNKIETKNTVG